MSESYNSKRSLLALSAAAAAIPGPAQALQTGYRFSLYDEAALPAGQAASGQSSERYRIQTHQLSLSAAPSREWELDADLMIESMSGASPWFVVPSADGQPVQIMSGATIQDERYAMYGKAWRALDGDKRLGLSAGVSDEKDYFALSAGLEGEWELAGRQRTLSLGIGYSDDQIEPTDGGSERFPDRISQADKSTWSAVAGLSQILSPRTIVQGGISVAYASGYLSDPYKLAFVEGRTVPDARPDSRQQIALNARLRHYLPEYKLGLQADYRWFGDDWGVDSDTIELGLWQRPTPQLRLSTRLRWYQQSRAAYYRPFYEEERGDGYYSSDYRLSAYGAVALRLGMDYFGQGWTLAAAVEGYEASGDYALRSVNLENPGLVEFLIYSVAVQIPFGASRAPASDSPEQGDRSIRVVQD